MAAKLKATIVGAGNVAWGLAPALEKGGAVKIVRVIARHEKSARALADALGLGVESTTDINLADKGVDLVILAVSDDSIAPLASSSPGSSACWIHTSGSIDSSVLSAASGDYGVVYPMQTFTRGVKVDLSNAPIYIEASSPERLATLTEIARSVSSNVKEADSTDRRRLHCAAVFACNFTNHLWMIADRIASDAGASIDDFMPLIHETVRKATEVGPLNGQTGPARRNAASVMEAHEKLLSPDYRDIYHLLSQSIISTYEQD